MIAEPRRKAQEGSKDKNLGPAPSQPPLPCDSKPYVFVKPLSVYLHVVLCSTHLRLITVLCLCTCLVNTRVCLLTCCLFEQQSVYLHVLCTNPWSRRVERYQRNRKLAHPSRFDHCGMNWIVPKKFIAFAGALYH